MEENEGEYDDESKEVVSKCVTCSVPASAEASLSSVVVDEGHNSFMDGL
jgi:hypothetical protein